MERINQGKRNSRRFKQNIILAGTLLNIFASCYIIGEFDVLSNYIKKINQNSTVCENDEIEIEEEVTDFTEIISPVTDVMETTSPTTTTTEVSTTKATEATIRSSESKSAQTEEVAKVVKKESKIQSKLMALPDYDTSFKTYMDYRCITNTASEQYKLQQEAWTDDLGLRRYGDYYLVAMGTYYSNSVGDKFQITLEGDKTFCVMIGDVKQDAHTDKNNMYSAIYDNSGTIISANVIEFIVDTKQLDKKVKLMGSINAYNEFNGNITKIEKIIE